MTNLAVFAADFEGEAIRVNEKGQFSVFDVLSVFVKPTVRNGKQAEDINPRQVYKSITERNPEVVQFCDNFKFSGKGQRDTPVADRRTIVMIEVVAANHLDYPRRPDVTPVPSQRSCLNLP